MAAQHQHSAWQRPIERRLTRGRPRRAIRERPSRDRHSRKCQICSHPRRQDIEHDFLRWLSPDRIATQYGLADHSTVYRHVHATGLFKRRSESIHLALDSILEQGNSVVNVSAHSILQAVKFSAILDGKWVEPPRNHVPHTQRIDTRRTESPNRQIPVLDRSQLSENKGAVSS
jgi:hypothetical protein